MRPVALIFETLQKRGILNADLAQNLKAEIVPSPDPIAIMQIRSGGAAVVNVRLMKAAAGTYRAGPTSVTVVPGADVVRVEEFLAGLMIDAAVFHVAHFSYRRVDEAMA